jgi:hypothetical protein
VRYASHDAYKNKPELSCDFPRVTVSYYLLPLLFKKLIINTVTVEKPIVEINSPPRPGTIKKTQSGGVKEKGGQELFVVALKQALSTLPYTVLIRKIAVKDCQMIVMRDGKPMVSGRGIDLTLSVGIGRGLSIGGRLSSPELTLFESVRLSDCNVSIRSKGTEVSLYDCRAGLFKGELAMKGAADLSTGTLTSFTLSLNGLSLEEWYRASGGAKGDVTGAFNANVVLEKSELAVDSLKGKGWVRAISVSTQGTPLHKNLMLRLVIPKLEILKFDKIYSDLLIQRGRITTGNFYGKGDPFDFNAKGWVGMDGRLSERVEGIFSAGFTASLAPIVRNSLLPVEKDKDRSAFKCTVQGTLENPQIEIDQRIVDRAVGNVFDALGKLFKR